MDRGILPLHQMEERGLLLPLPDAKLQEMQRHQPPVTLMPICTEPQIAQGLDQDAGQEKREGQPSPEEVTCGKVVNNGAETWGERQYEAVERTVRQLLYKHQISVVTVLALKTFLPQTATFFQECAQDKYTSQPRAHPTPIHHGTSLP